jgi:nifR3 family TIM-barrel protein
VAKVSQALKKPFRLGSLELPNNIFYAPLAGCSDFPFRKMTARYRPGLIYCEMVKMEPLVRRVPNTLKMLDYEPSMHPIGAQICGSKPELAGPAAKIIEEMGFDTVDLNCGCPVDKVTKDGSGSGMLKNPQLIGEVLSNIVAAVKIPVTVKIRLGWDDESINAVDITKIAEAAGAKAICIHGRTRKQAYQGSARWNWIKACKEAADHILVIGNGDLFDAHAAVRMFEETGCDALMVSRGTLGQPWIVQDMIAALDGRAVPERSVEDFRQGLLDHFECIVGYHLPPRAVLDMRRVGCWYLKKSFGVRSFRDQISRATSLDQVREILQTLSLANITGEDEGGFLDCDTCESA